MKLTAKGRCAISSMIEMACHEKRLSIKEIALKHDLSVRYLEQVFSLLKKGKLVSGTKGPQGGYTLNKGSDEIRVSDILFAVEGRQMFHQESNNSDALNQVMDDMIFLPLDQKIEGFLEEIRLSDLVKSYQDKNNEYMYYI